MLEINLKKNKEKYWVSYPKNNYLFKIFNFLQLPNMNFIALRVIHVQLNGMSRQ